MRAAVLSASVVDVVACRLDAAPDEIDALRAWLSPDERARADRFHVERARDRFVVARGRARQLLGALSGRPPAAVRFVVAPGGKPGLEEGGGLRFSLAHSADLLLCAFTLDREVGVDVERVRDDLDHDAIARRFFGAPEVRSLAALPPATARDAFFACWTRKEAVVKATGEGLARPLDSFVVSVDPAHAALLSADDPALGCPEEWSLLPVPLPPGYHGTVAVRGAATLRPWSWPVAWIDAAPARGK
jgi:4'-phosphopantetheinyl transferase